jgi:hypothetical protein
VPLLFGVKYYLFPAIVLFDMPAIFMLTDVMSGYSYIFMGLANHWAATRRIFHPAILPLQAGG